MLKKFIPVLIFILFFLGADAQQNNAAYFFHAGIQYKNNNQPAEAAASFNKAISLNKKLDSAYVELGHLYIQARNAPAGIYNFKKALTINPAYTAALISLGKIYKDISQNLDSALYFYHAALKIDNSNIETFAALAWLYNTNKDYDQSIFYAAKALEVDNDYKPAYGELAFAFRATKKYEEAIVQFKKNLAVSVVDVAYLYTGYCYTELNNKEGAMEQYEALNKINEKMAAALKRKIDSMPSN